MKKVFVLAVLVALVNIGFAQSEHKVIRTLKVGGVGGWDYIAVQPNSTHLFLSHGTQINIIDKNTGEAIGNIPNTLGVHGMAFVPALNKGFTSNGKTNNSYCFNLATLAVTDSLATGQKPDAIYYDNALNAIVICNGKSKDLTFIDPNTNKELATVSVGGTPETAVGDGKGHVFVNIEDKNEIVKIDATTYQVIAHWSLAPGEAPTGLAIDTEIDRLFAACSDNKLLVILDAKSGNIIDKLPIGDGCDGAVFDAKAKNIYTSNGKDGTITVVHEYSAIKYAVTETIPTKKGARTIAIDDTTQALYLPTADIEAAKEGQRPKAIPGSFQVVVVGK